MLLSPDKNLQPDDEPSLGRVTIPPKRNFGTAPVDEILEEDVATAAAADAVSIDLRNDPPGGENFEGESRGEGG